MTDKPVSRAEQWTRNSANRRNAIKAAGGRQLLTMVKPEDNAMLTAILAHRVASNADYNLTKWVAQMIKADYLTIQRGLRRQRGKAGGPKG
jgi:hypothetical protein